MKKHTSIRLYEKDAEMLKRTYGSVQAALDALVDFMNAAKWEEILPQSSSNDSDEKLSDND